MHHETALDWFQRSNSNKSGRGRPRHHPPQTPLEAAHHFCQGHSGLSYIDHVWQSHSSSSSSVVIALEGKSSHSRAAVTWTLRSLVAKFVVATRASAFAADSDVSQSQQSQQSAPPQVLILDTKGDFVGPTACRALHHVLASTLNKKKKNTMEGRRHPTNNSHNDEDEDLQECARRISIINASQYAPVALLEVLAQQQQQQQQQQTSATTALLIVWNGLNDGTSSTMHHHDTTTNQHHHHSNLLLCQQWARAVVAASKHDNDHHWQWVVATEKVGPLQTALQAKTKTMGVQRVLLEPRQQGKDCVATVLGKQFSFSLSLEGILS